MHSVSSSILIVDDEDELASLFREFIIEMGYDAVSFTNPLLAIEHFQQAPTKYSMVITDLRMPGICGMELANKIREMNTTVKVLLMTAFDIADIKDHQAYIAENIDQILQKPIRFPVLRKIIEQNIIIPRYTI